MSVFPSKFRRDKNLGPLVGLGFPGSHGLGPLNMTVPPPIPQPFPDADFQQVMLDRSFGKIAVEVDKQLLVDAFNSQRAAFSQSGPPPVADRFWDYPGPNSSVDVTGYELTSMTPQAGGQCDGHMLDGSGDWYWEIEVVSGQNFDIGIKRNPNNHDYPGRLGFATSGSGYMYTGQKINSSQTAYGAAYTSGDIIGVYIEDNGDGTFDVSYLKNNVSQGVAFSHTWGTGIVPSAGIIGGTGAVFLLRTGSAAAPFNYTPPVGAQALTLAPIYT